MPGISLSKLRDSSRTVKIRFGDDVLRVDIYPDRFTNEVVDRYANATQEDPKDYEEMAAALREVVASWDLYANEGDEEPLPIDGETLETHVSLRVLNHIWAELTDAVTPKSQKKNDRS